MTKSEYSFTSKMLHRIALQWAAVGEMAFDAESAFIKQKEDEVNEEPVFISGLARSGTTMLMRYIHDSGRFRSLTYQDMPFVMMPNIWKKIAGRKAAGEIKERAHKDGIMVSFDSPEAFDEIFWRVFQGNKYIGKDSIQPAAVSSDLISKFRKFILHALLSAEDRSLQRRYLSKNNNNVIRLDTLKAAFPASKLIIPFRNPLRHAASLMAQHELFTKVQLADPFSLHYMNWLGHYEFGLNQKPFYFGDNEYYKKFQNTPKSVLDYWLLSWINYYDHVLECKIPDLIFCQYESFCEQPEGILKALYSELNITANPPRIRAFTPKDKRPGNYDEVLMEQCVEKYEKLNERFREWYPNN